VSFGSPMAQDLWLRMSTLLAHVHTCDRRVGIRLHSRTLSATKISVGYVSLFFLVPDANI